MFCCMEVPRRRGAAGVQTWLRTLGLPQIVVALTVAATVHAWWTLPALVFRAPTLPPGYGDVVGIHALSLMHLSNGLLLFHPFWFANDQHLAPINPLFFVLPMLVFGPMLRHRSDTLVMFLLNAALIAAFLVKGDNEPAGDIYDWLFVHLPGFSLFRDASKFYQPLAVAYALLLGVAALELSRIVGSLWRMQHHVGTAIVALVFVGVAAFPAYPALLQQGRGTFGITPMPADYARFNALVDRQRAFFRVLWVPARPRFGGFSGNHPALDAAQIGACCIRVLSQPNRAWPWMSSPSVVEMLQALAVRYIVEPDAATSEFIGQTWWTPGSGGSAAAILSALRTFLPGLRESVIGHLHVFVNPAAYPLLMTVPGTSQVQRGVGCAIGSLCVNASSAVAQLRAVRQPTGDGITSVTDRGSWYDVRVRAGGHPVYLVLQQTYDPNWLAFAERDGQAIWPWTTLVQRSLPRSAHVVANGYANAWRIPEPGTGHVVLEYWPRRLALLGWLVTIMSLLFYLGIALLRIRPRGRRTLLGIFYCMRLPAPRLGQRRTAELRGN
jgi:hypothetical protein